MGDRNTSIALGREATWQFGDILVIGIQLLFFKNGDNLLPGFKQTHGTMRQVGFDLRMQLPEIVAWHCGVHVVFCVVVHVPVQEADEWI